MRRLPIWVAYASTQVKFSIGSVINKNIFDAGPVIEYTYLVCIGYIFILLL